MIWTSALATALSVAGVASASAATPSITETGSSLVYPIASVWASRFSGVDVETSSGGSDRGIQAIIHNQVDIGASDVPLDAAQFRTGSADYVEIPWALSATGIGYHLPGVGTGLRLNARILADIYTAKITRWGDPLITRLNPGEATALRRDGKITPVFRSDGSGTTYSFQRFLTEAAPSIWRLGYSGAFGGTTGVAEPGDAGVADEVEKVRGAIGYISGAYLLQAHLSVARIANAAGNYEFPNIPNIIAAADSAGAISTQGPNFGGVPIVDPPRQATTAYPIATYSYAIASKSNSRVMAVQAFLNWVISPRGGQQYGVLLDFAPLPLAIRNADAKLINQSL